MKTRRQGTRTGDTLSDYVVVRTFDPIHTEWLLEVRNYRAGKEDSLLAEGKVLGKDFVTVSGEGSPERAEKRAKAYLENTHQAPESIDGWVRSVTRQ